MTQIPVKLVGMRWWWLSCLLAFSTVVSAALFDDDEARKKIIEVEAAMKAHDKVADEALAELQQQQKAIMQRLSSVEAVVKGPGLADMQTQIELLKQSLSTLKGSLELLEHNTQDTQQQQKDLYSDIDTRLRRLDGIATTLDQQMKQLSADTQAQSTKTSDAPTTANKTAEDKVPVPDATPSNTTTNVSTSPAPSSPSAKNSAEYQLLELAHGLSKEKKYNDAFNAYNKFLREYPNSTMADEAHYGLGNAQFALKNYKSAMATQQKLLNTYPNSPKVPYAWLGVASSQIQLGQVADAKKTLQDVLLKFPSHTVAAQAQKYLKILESIKP